MASDALCNSFRFESWRCLASQSFVDGTKTAFIVRGNLCRDTSSFPVRILLKNHLQAISKMFSKVQTYLYTNFRPHTSHV